MTRRASVEFEDNGRAAMLYGPHNAHLAYLEDRLDVQLSPRGNRLQIEGAAADVTRTMTVLRALYQRLEARPEMSRAVLEAALVPPLEGHPESSQAESRDSGQDQRQDAIVHLTGGGIIEPRTEGQRRYIQMLKASRMVFCSGPAGTGKTFLAVAYGVSLIQAKAVDTIMLTRPAVEAGERLGFLPGDLREKIDPYLQPLYDALRVLVRPKQIEQMIADRRIDIAPLAFMRGRTLARAFVVLDEAQNATPTQMKMFLTRLGNQGRMVIAGDPSQVDVAGPSGLVQAQKVLSGVPGIAFAQLRAADVVRDDLVARIVAAYEQASPTKDVPATKKASSPLGD
ncbi:MAG: PhoH family protein [Pseudomonadota bacterium]